MKTITEGQRHWSATVAIVTLIALAITAPLLVGDNGRDGGLQRAAVLAAARDSFTISHPLRLVELPRVTIEHGTISFVRSSGERMPTGQAMLAILAGGSAGLAIEDATLVLDGATGAGEPAPPTNEPVAPIVEALSRHAYKTLTLTRSRLVVERQNGEPLVLDDVTATVSANKKSERSARGSFTFRGKPVEFDVALGIERADGAPPKGAAVSVSIKSELISADFEGRLALDDSLQLVAHRARIRGDDLRQTARWLGANWPEGAGLKSFAIDGTLDWSNRALAFTDASITVDGNTAAGTLALKTSGQRPAIDGTLAFERLDLSPYFSLTETRDLVATFSLGRLLSWRDWTEPQPGALAEQVDADLRLSSDLVVVANGELGRGAATLALKAGMLLADVAEIDLGGGARCRGQLSVDFGTSVPLINLKAELAQIELTHITNRLFGHYALRGRSELNLDLTTSGSTTAELISAASGQIGISVPRGGQIGADIRALVATTLTKELDGWGAAGRGQTAFESLKAELTIDNGALTLQRAAARSGATLLTATGTIGVADRTVDMNLAISHLVGQANALAAPLKSEQGPANGSVLQIQGQWSTPRIRRLELMDKATREVSRSLPMLLGGQGR